jgi:hypothetical protein
VPARRPSVNEKQEAGTTKSETTPDERHLNRLKNDYLKLNGIRAYRLFRILTFNFWI